MLQLKIIYYATILYIVFVTGAEQHSALDRVYQSLASVVDLHCALQYELVQLHHNAVAADVPGTQSQR